MSRKRVATFANKSIMLGSYMNQFTLLMPFICLLYQADSICLKGVVEITMD